MADEPKQPASPIVPDLFTIPFSLIEQWTEIPANERLLVPLTRIDIDHLMMGLIRTIESQALLDRTLVEWSNGRMDEANRFINEFRRQNVDAQNSVRQFAAAVMSSATRERKRA